MRSKFCLLVAVSGLAWAQPALAATGRSGHDRRRLTLDPILAARLRYEMVDQANSPTAPTRVTAARARRAPSSRRSGFSFLAEGEGTLALVDDYNDTLAAATASSRSRSSPIPRTSSSTGCSSRTWSNGTGVDRRPPAHHPRQRALRRHRRLAAERADLRRGARRRPSSASSRSTRPTRSRSARCSASTARTSTSTATSCSSTAASTCRPVDVKAFAYLLDYDTRLAFSSQTYGVLATGDVRDPRRSASSPGSPAMPRRATTAPTRSPTTPTTSTRSSALACSGFALTAGYEELGSDGGVAAFQTPLATLHAFNGWADLFLTTPGDGPARLLRRRRRRRSRCRSCPGSRPT